MPVMRGWPRNLTERTEHQPDGCLLHLAPPTRGGYCVVWRDGRTVPAHVAAYELWVGPVPAGYHVDHLCHDPAVCFDGDRCRHRRCVEPAHLRAVPAIDNYLRSSSPWAVNAAKTHCRWGHPLPPYIPGRVRRCGVCEAARQAWRQHAVDGGLSLRRQRRVPPEPKGARLCDGCGAEIAPDKRRGTKFCTPACRVNTWRRAHR